MGCDRDCFHCEFPDCVMDDETENEVEAAEKRDAYFAKINRSYYCYKRYNKYNRSEKGIAARNRYDHSDKRRKREYRGSSLSRS